MGRAGVERVRSVLAWERQEERYLDVYRSLVPVAPTLVTGRARCAS
jgi:hypothetical protein